ncbi:non-ribosomal peptide synthetase, partial [Gloeocapsopsis crepidinum]
ADGWSVKVLVQELSILYQASIGKSSSLPELPIQYLDFTAWQRQWLQGEVVETHLAYWKQQLSGLSVLKLPTDYPRQPIQTYRGAQQKFTLSLALTNNLKQFDGTLFMTLLAAFNVLLYRYTGQEDIVIGSPIANRNSTQIESLIGCFINTLVLRTELDGNLSFQELVGRVGKVAVDAYIHQDLPFEKLVEELQLSRDLSYHPLFQVMFVLQNSDLTNIVLPELSWKTRELDTSTAKFDLFLSMIDSEEGLIGTLEYNTDLFKADTISRMIVHFQTLLEAVVIYPNEWISRLPLLTPTERQTLLHDWNNTQINYPQNTCIHHLFEQQVAKTPENIALIFEDRQLTYRELNQRANKLAHYLIKLGIKPDVMVGICMERSIEMVVGILGILKAGGAYVPLDPTYPKERLAFMLADSQVSVLLTQPSLKQLLGNRAQVVCIDTEDTVFDNCSSDPVVDVKSQNLAYVIYTSGSTGKPKGAMNVHRGLCNRLLWMQETYQLTSCDRILQKTPFSFDVSVWEFFLPLITGASLVVAKPGGHKDASYLVELIAQQKITILHFVPSMLQAFLEEPALEKCQSIAKVICSGEALPFNLQKRFFERLNAELHNLYGPTEASIDVTAWQCQKDSHDRIVPIGRPIANTQIYILDKHLQPVPIGISGELYIGGIGLARGYWNRPDLTKEKFISSPFVAGERLYKTGDLARFCPDGNIEFLGRIDYQVKIRGFRIEIGEIEAVLQQHPQVRETIVVARDKLNQDQTCLVAYIVLTQKANIFVNELRDFLKEKLPEYMLPSAFVILDEFPLTANGKIDRFALPSPQIGLEIRTNYQPPQSEIEKAIAQVWQQVLQLEKVSIHDNFFDLGGHSIMMLQVNNKLRHILQRDISVVSMFQHPTIHSLAQSLNQQLSPPMFGKTQNRAQKQIASMRRQSLRQGR